MCGAVGRTGLALLVGGAGELVSGEARRLDRAGLGGYTAGMKVAVSIPDRIFEEAEEIARRLGTSRSEVYARALDAFAALHAPDRVTAALDAAVEAAGGGAGDGFSQEAARRALGRAEW